MMTEGFDIDGLLGPPASAYKTEGGETIRTHRGFGGRKAALAVEALEADGVEVVIVRTPDDLLKAFQEMPVPEAEAFRAALEDDFGDIPLLKAAKRIIDRRKAEGR